MPRAKITSEEQERSLIARTRQAISSGSLSDEASLKTVARRLGLSRRTLQRRLDEQGTRLIELVASVRSEQAKELIGGGRSAAAVSRMLGFSAPSAFHRAFARWTGMTPEQYRRARSKAETERNEFAERERRKVGVAARSQASSSVPANPRRTPTSSNGEEQHQEAIFRKVIGEIGLARAREVLVDLERRLINSTEDG